MGRGVAATAEAYVLGFARVQLAKRAYDAGLWAVGVDAASWEGARLVRGTARGIGLQVLVGDCCGANEDHFFGDTAMI